MNILPDAPTLIWFLDGNETELSLKANQLISDTANVPCVSTASLQEKGIKIRLSSLAFEPGYDNLLAMLDQNGFKLLLITLQHTRHWKPKRTQPGRSNCHTEPSIRARASLSGKYGLSLERLQTRSKNIINVLLLNQLKIPK